ncbi:glucokinase [Scopulibacillus daqui]|uniref:Glucokinase n=1 Tax=Scopulibacillus daqui TaxID=1469162 RepID=A0ABS2Q245_9BACL|nr:ROK family glucokinase [Scopulibacillus daqui]MBM7646362.1 glucokinase [Scopulibacillus daqui]
MSSNKWYIGIDLGGTSVKMAFIDDEAQIIDKWNIKTDTTNNGENIVKDISESIKTKIEEHQKDKDHIKGIGMGSPGFLEIDEGFVYHSVNIGWKNYPLKDELEKAVGLPVIVDNDANIAAIGEMWKGAGEGAKDVLCVTLGTGVGGGVITDGEIVHGVNGMAGEIGHTTAVLKGGVLCNCGKTGCLETVSSATAIRRMAIEGFKDHPESRLKKKYDKEGDISSKDVLDFAKEQDHLAMAVVKKASFHLGFALANFATVMNPAKIVIGGGVSKAGDTLLDPVKHYFRMYALPRVNEGVEIVAAQLGNDAGIIGAAWLAKTKL